MISEPIQVVLDVGSTKVGAIVTRRRGRRVHVLGHGVSPCETGAALGAAIDIEATSASIRESVECAERRARVRIGEVYASIAQPCALGFRAADAQLVADREALVLSAERAGVSVLDFVPSAVASATATLSRVEREAGAALVDLGAGVTNVAVYRGGRVALTHVLAFGAADVTASIAAHFDVTLSEAEFLKRNGCCVPDHGGTGDDRIAVPSCSHGEGTAVSRRALARAIESRSRPLWQAVGRVLGGVDLPAGVAITGGGSLLAGMHEVAERVLGRPVRCATPCGLADLPGELQSPAFATLVGLAQYASEHGARLGERSLTWGRRRLASA